MYRSAKTLRHQKRFPPRRHGLGDVNEIRGSIIYVSGTITSPMFVRWRGSVSFQVYVVLWEAAANDVGATVEEPLVTALRAWLLKLEASGRQLKALDKLLDAGFIQIEREERNKGGSNNTVWRVTIPRCCRCALFDRGNGPTQPTPQANADEARRPDTSSYYETQCYGRCRG